MRPLYFNTEDKTVVVNVKPYDMLFSAVYLKYSSDILGKISKDNYHRTWTVFLNNEHCTNSLYHVAGFKTKRLAVEFILKMNGIRIL